MTDTAAARLPAPEWQRLHPATLALAIARLGPRSLNLLPALAAVGFVGRWAYVLPALALFLLVSLVGAWLVWLRFRYQLGDDEIVIESGVIARQHRTIPFDRIQDVSIEQGLIARALGIAKVGFETGGGGQDKADEAKLDAIALTDAQALRGTIRAHRGQALAAAPIAATDGEAVGAAAAPEDRLLFAMGPRQLLVAGLFNFSLAALAIVGAGAQFFDNFLPFNLFKPDDWMDLAGRYGLDSWLLAHRWLAGVGAGVSLLLIGFASGVVTMVFANWGFRLTREPRALRRTRGLTTRTDVAIPVRRVQAAIVVTGWFRQRFGWHELRLQSLATDGGNEKDHQVVPFGTLLAVDQVLGEIAIVRPSADEIWHQSHRVIALGGLVGAVGAAIGGTIAVWLGLWPGWIALLSAPPIAAAALVGARYHRWADLPDQVAIRRGLLKPRLTLLPHASVQSIDLKSGVLLRRLGLATLVFGVPGGSSLGAHAIPAIPWDAATDLRARMLAARAHARGARCRA